MSHAWQAGWLRGWLAGWLRPREAQRGPERRSVDRTSLSCAWMEAPTSRFTTREAPHRYFHVWNPRGSPHRLPRRTKGSKQKSTSNPGSPHKQKYDQGGSPQAELRPGRLPTSRTETREPTWLAGGWLWAELLPGNLSCAWAAGWLAGGLAGWLRPREAHRGPERPREAQADRG